MLIKEHSIHGGIQKIYRFDNNRGASVIKHDGSYGGDIDLWELGVIRFYDDTQDWHLDCTTPITEDVLGYLTWEDVEELLARISKLEKVEV